MRQLQENAGQQQQQAGGRQLGKRDWDAAQDPGATKKEKNESEVRFPAHICQLLSQNLTRFHVVDAYPAVPERQSSCMYMGLLSRCGDF